MSFSATVIQFVLFWIWHTKLTYSCKICAAGVNKMIIQIKSVFIIHQYTKHKQYIYIYIHTPRFVPQFSSSIIIFGFSKKDGWGVRRMEEWSLSSDLCQLMKWCLMSSESDVSWHIRDKFMPVRIQVNLYPKTWIHIGVFRLQLYTWSFFFSLHIGCCFLHWPRIYYS